MPRLLWRSWGGGRFLMSEVTLQLEKSPRRGIGASPSETLLFFFTLVTGPRRSLSLKLSNTRVYEPQTLGTALNLRTNLQKSG